MLPVSVSAFVNSEWDLWIATGELVSRYLLHLLFLFALSTSTKILNQMRYPCMFVCFRYLLIHSSRGGYIPSSREPSWSCLPIHCQFAGCQFDRLKLSANSNFNKREIVTLCLRISKRTVTFAVNKVFQTHSAAFTSPEYPIVVTSWSCCSRVKWRTDYLSVIARNIYSQAYF